MAPLFYFLWFASLLTTFTEGSEIFLHGTPQTLLGGLTPNLTLRCSLKDSPASGVIIGRRDVIQTADNLSSVSSMIIMMNGVDIASVSMTKPAHVMNVSSNIQTSGSVTGGSGETAFIEIIILNPDKSQTGEYTCEANALSDSGHIVTFSTSFEIEHSSLGLDDLAVYVRQLIREKDEMKQTITDLDNKYDALMKKTEAKVFFSVALVDDFSLTTGDKVLVFEDVFSNVGGAYDNSTGLFVSQIAGYYKFVLNTFGSADLRHYTTLQKNNNDVFLTYARGSVGSHDESTNSVIIQLAAGDVIQVVAHAGSHLLGNSHTATTTYRGELVAAL